MTDMTIDDIKKAIREIEISYDYNHRKNDYDIVLNLTELANLIKTLQGKAIDEALEKQIPKKVVMDKNIYICPECGANVETDCGDDMLDYRLNYCDN